MVWQSILPSAFSCLGSQIDLGRPAQVGGAGVELNQLWSSCLYSYHRSVVINRQLQGVRALGEAPSSKDHSHCHPSSPGLTFFVLPPICGSPDFAS